MKQLLTIQLVGWNGAKHLEDTAQALVDVPQDIARILYMDNGSTDNSVDIIQKLLPKADIMRLESNIGFASAHNAGFKQCTTPFVLTLDQDITIIWEGIAQLLEAMQNDETLGAVQGKLWRKQAQPRQNGGQNFVLDSAGITQTLTLNGKERGANEEDVNQYNQQARLLAVTGGCGLYRMEALKQVAHTAPVIPASEPESTPPLAGPSQVRDDDRAIEVFDEEFFSYKEDVDLGWRLNNAGWRVEYIPVAVGYHARTMGKRGAFSWGTSLTAIRERINSPRTKWSLRNYIWMIAKNASKKQIILHWPFIKTRLFVLFIFSLFSPQLFSAWGEAWRGIGKMRRKGGRE